MILEIQQTYTIDQFISTCEGNLCVNEKKKTIFTIVNSTKLKCNLIINTHLFLIQYY